MTCTVCDLPFGPDTHMPDESCPLASAAGDPPTERIVDPELEAVAARQGELAARVRRTREAREKALEVLGKVVDLAIQAAPYVLEELDRDGLPETVGRKIAEQAARWIRRNNVGPLP